MKAILISGKPRWSALIMNGDKTVEVRTSKTLAKAIQTLIDEYGYADIYWYCSKDGYLHLENNGKWSYSRNQKYTYIRSGKVIFKFRCFKVEEITPQMFTPIIEHEILKKSCLKECELFDYVCLHDGTEDRPFYAIYISDLEIFGKPKELSEFNHYSKCKRNLRTRCLFCHALVTKSDTYCIKSLTKAPQNFAYIEVEG